MAGRSRVLLRIYLVGSRVADRRRAEQIVDGLASRRPVSGGAGEWRVVYDTEEVSEAMRICEADLAELDPSWLEILDFAALPTRPRLHIESE
jgi:hypothetical protein